MILNISLSSDKDTLNIFHSFIQEYSNGINNHYDNDLLDSTVERNISDNFLKEIFSLQDDDILFLHAIEFFIKNFTNFHSYSILYIDITRSSLTTSTTSFTTNMSLGLPIVIYNNTTSLFEFKHLRFSNISQLKDFFINNEIILPVEIVTIFNNHYHS